MSVDKAAGINHGLIGKILTNQNLAKTEESKKTSSSVFNEGKALNGGDMVEISSEAKELHKMLSGLKSEIKHMPDTREDKIKMAKARIAEGVYDSNDVIKDVAKSIKDSGLV
ncbi:anti-sigma-28 factor [Candidatus Scalindua japonica]|uniref:Anti-sigma-28 factor n=1 Tax=Candidatus Scalindua japonica TaxID=1284222 RepID=A0A286TW44_9BACT|nr:flagellar biosynthesis anti-sigma factor FlgM [Candidatus Scalindua japonica]GAX60064.1 anti-sigma-28 factor [Candidatus Scalindua japonica]